MKRALRIFAGFMTVTFVLGCHEREDAPVSAGGGGGGGSPPAYAPAPSSQSPAASALLRSLAERKQSSDFIGAASDGGVDAGRILFDGARSSGGAPIPVNFATASGGRSYGSSSAYARMSPGVALDARSSSRRGSEPPLPDDPAFLKAAAGDAGRSARGAGAVLLGFAADELAQGYATVYPILSRAGWHAAPRRGAPIAMRATRVTVHHTDGRQTMTEAETAAEVRSIQRFHMGRERGWDDVGYHFLIDGAGRVVEGRPADTLGAHVMSANENNIGVALMGDFEKTHPTRAQVESLTRLVSYLAVKYKEDPSQRGFLQPHRHYGNTDCPGRNMMTIFEELRADVDGEARRILANQNAAPGRFQPVAVVGNVDA